MHTEVGISFFGLIFLGLLIASVGMGLLSLLAIRIRALTGQRRVHRPEKIGAWSGVWTALIATATVFAALFIIGVLVYRARAVTQTAMSRDASVRVELNRAEVQRVRVEPEQKSYGVIPVDATAPLDAAATALPAEADDGEAVKAGEDKARVEHTPVADQTAAESSVTVAASDADKAAFLEARKVQLQELSARIGQLVRSHLESAGETSGASPLGQAAKSNNGDVVVFQPSDDMVQLLLSAIDQNVVKSFNDDLPGRIRQTYALIPLTPPVGATVPVRPLLAAGSLELIANSIVSMVEQAEHSTPAETVANDVVATQPESGDTLTVAPLSRAMPEWMNKTDGRRIVARSKPILPGDDVETPLNAAINEALAQHIAAVTATMNTALHDQAQFVRMELPSAAAKKCVVDTYERLETIKTEAEGEKSFRVLYALLEFPEAVDQIAVRQIRQSIQQDRIASLGIVVGCAWLSICSAGFGIWQWRKGTRVRRLAAAPVFAVITIPMLLAAGGMVVAISQGNVPHAPWNSQPVTVELHDI